MKRDNSWISQPTASVEDDGLETDVSAMSSAVWMLLIVMNYFENLG
jgi:hypothetical protein